MKAPLLVVSESMALDTITHKLSVFNVIEKVNLPAIPSYIPFMAVVAILERAPDEPGSATVQVRVTINGDPVANPSINLDFAGGERIRAIQNISGILVHSAGNLKLEIEHEGTTLAAWEVRVDVAGQPAIEAQAGVSPAPAPENVASAAGRKRRSTPRR